MGGTVRTEHDGAIGWLVFDHPERRNAISVEMWEAIPAAMAALDGDPAVRVIVMRGAGDVAFVSGADISEFASRRTGEKAAEYDALNARAYSAVAEAHKPVVALIHGFCVGGGVGLALQADLRYAADDARFAVPAARLGLGYSARGVENLVRLVGPSSTKEILFTARRFSAAEALRMGLVNAVLPKVELEGAVRDTATRMAENAPLTLRSVKTLCEELGKPSSERDEAGAAASIRACFESEDYQEGVRAFLEKRSPTFRGR
ncbi:MAG: enoyl-CoA hydratase [Myxococcota bacterium]|nr:enoyl-CoA hydratase [Myxococcota bacterium]